MMARNGTGRMEYGRGKKAGPERLQLGIVITEEDDALLTTLTQEVARRMEPVHVTRRLTVQLALRALAREYGLLDQ